MTTNLFVIAKAKQLRTLVVLEFYCLFFRTSLGVGVLNSAIFLTVFTIGLSLARFWRAFGISGGGVEPPNHPTGYATGPPCPCKRGVCVCASPHQVFQPTSMFRELSMDDMPQRTAT